MKTVYLDQKKLSIKYLFQLAESSNIQLELSEKAWLKIKKSHEYFKNSLHNGQQVYGTSTGFGANVLTSTKSENLQTNLSRYLDCAQGPIINELESRAALIARTYVLIQGYSGVSPALILSMLNMYNKKISPIIPQWGALGASGDLVTAAPMARLINGDEVDCWHQGRLTNSTEIKKYLKVHKLNHRDGLAVMNGLSITAVLMAGAVLKLEDLLNVSLKSIAATKVALGADPETEAEIVNSAPTRQHSGQKQMAKALYTLYKSSYSNNREGAPLQDEYSLRCLGQILGPIYDSIKQSKSWIQSELLSVSDNPVVKAGSGIQSGGNFFGGYLATASDYMAIAASKLGELLERQSFHLVSGSRNLPNNLIIQSDANDLHHGLKGLHQICSSLQMQIHHYSNPVSTLSRSSESHNQDIVSNAMNGYLRLDKQIEVLQSLSTVHSILSAQAIDLSESVLKGSLRTWHSKVREYVPFVKRDQSLRNEIKNLCDDLFKKNSSHVMEHKNAA